MSIGDLASPLSQKFKNVNLIRDKGSFLFVRIFNKKFPPGAKVPYVLETLAILIESYGPRSYSSLDGLDLKAIGHAFRVAYEVKAFMKTGKITFPLPERDFLLEIKTGKIPDYGKLLLDLEDLISSVSALSNPSLPQEPDTAFVETWLLNLYKAP